MGIGVDSTVSNRDRHEETLDQLLSSYPLPAGYEQPEIFADTLELHGLSIGMCGLAACGPDGQTITGSAAELGNAPLARAYFELVERTTIVEASKNPRPSYELLDEEGRIVGEATADQVFPPSPADGSWRYALSNGVAAHTDFREACRRAALELVERDRVLRSWYGEIEPLRIAPRTSPLPKELDVDYEVQTYLFEEPDGAPRDGARGAHVAGVFAFPRRLEAPMVYGFAARETIAWAVAGAASECLQRLAFLWGEEIPTKEPEPSASPGYHQEYYLWPERHEALQGWLGGASGGCREPSLEGEPDDALQFVDVTPRKAQERRIVVKCVSTAVCPLTFGIVRVGADLPRQFSFIHPVA